MTELLWDDTRLSNAGRKAHHGSYAHFPGTGPENTYCRGCSFYKAYPKKDAGVCQKYKQMVKTVAKDISPGALSCKYFENKKK